MIEEAVLFAESDRYFLTRSQIDPVTQPDDTYDDECYADYFAYYAGYGAKFRPERIFEIGVRYGCTAICMLLGHAAARLADANLISPFYRGIDDESQWYGSCARANRNFAAHAPWSDAEARKWNSFDGPPPTVADLTFDLIHVDGLHAYNSASNELRWCWPMLAPNGIIVMDDADTPGVAQAIREFLTARAPLHGELVRHQFVRNYRNHHLIQRCIP